MEATLTILSTLSILAMGAIIQQEVGGTTMEAGVMEDLSNGGVAMELMERMAATVVATSARRQTTTTTKTGTNAVSRGGFKSQTAQVLFKIRLMNGWSKSSIGTSSSSMGDAGVHPIRGKMGDAGVHPVRCKMQIRKFQKVRKLRNL